MEFSRQEYWNGLPFPSPGYLPNPGIKPGSPALQADSLPTELQGKPRCLWVCFIPIKNEGIWPGSREDKPEGNYNNLGEKTHLE